MKSVLLILTTLILMHENSVQAQNVDLSKAGITISEEVDADLHETCMKVMQEEVKKRTSIVLQESSNRSKTNITICFADDKEVKGVKLPKINHTSLPEKNPEGFRILYSEDDGTKTVWIIGADKRGILFGIGEFLRKAVMGRKKLTIATPLDFATSPAYPIRGHQLGYRNTANSYDAWSAEQYDQYIRDLVLFGTNAIENIPLGGKNNNSVLMKISRPEMNIALSNICNTYRVDYWVWMPVSIKLENKSLWDDELNRLEGYYRETPYLNDIFVPGGDPGDNHPKVLMPFLKEAHKRLQKYHPDAGLWVSLQGFNEEQIDYFYSYLKREKPTWLKGVVSGPGSPNIAETRYRLPDRYMHRQYPDITHNVRCEFPVRNFDQAFALTLGREGINPRPVAYATIHKKYAPFTDGFVSYSDGCHDDVNKIIWSQRGWNPEKPINDILYEYGKYFFGNDLSEDAVTGILALEKNWDGSLETNGSVETTFSFWKGLNSNHPELADNWRWQMLMLRAYYDAYTRRRLISEKGYEKEANIILANADREELSTVMAKALETINTPDRIPATPELKNEIVKYCELLYQSIGLQTSVVKYHARGSERGAILDFVDRPLNNRWWYQDQFKIIENMDSDVDKWKRLETIRKWENPGLGSFYDDISNIANSPHLHSIVSDAIDYSWFDGGLSRLRLSSQLYQFEPVLKYENLDPNARYIIRLTGYGEALLRIDGVRLDPYINNKGVEEIKEFVVPRMLVGDGKIDISFDQPDQSQLNWRKYSRISDIWLIKLDN